MFEDWKQAWRDAVENFEREISADDASASGNRSMRGQISSARGALSRLEMEIERALGEAASEREAEQVCLRRRTMAADIEDLETARIAAEYAARHGERAAIYERKAGVLQEERSLLLRDLESMAAEMQERLDKAVADGDTSGLFEGNAEDDLRLHADELDDGPARERARQEHEFDSLRRDRAATERLEELKRRMRS